MPIGKRGKWKFAAAVLVLCGVMSNAARAADKVLQNVSLTGPNPATLSTQVPDEWSDTVTLSAYAPEPDGETEMIPPPGQVIPDLGLSFDWNGATITVEKLLNAQTDTWSTPEAAGERVSLLGGADEFADGKVYKTGSLKAKFAEAGTYRITVTLPAQWWAGTGEYYRANPTLTLTMKVSGVTLNFTGLPRSCAGGVDNDAHTFTLGYNAKQGEANLANAALDFSFGNNQSHDPNRKAKFRTSVNTWAETTTLTTDANGNGSVTVLSSDIVPSNIKIVANYNGNEITSIKLNGNITQGGIACDFALPTNLRRFGVKDYVEDLDNGWLFNANLLTNPDEGTQLGDAGNVVPAKVYLKFRRNPNDATYPIDQNYFNVTTDVNGDGVPDLVASPTLDADGDGVITPDERDSGSVRRPLSDDGNWSFVGGHILRIKIVGVTRHDQDSVSPADFGLYATLLGVDGADADQPVGFIDVTTAAGDGAASVKIKSMDLIDEAEEILLEAEDQTVVAP